MIKDSQVQDIDCDFGDNIEFYFESRIPAEDSRTHQVKEHWTPLTLTQVEEHVLIIEEGEQAYDVTEKFMIVLLHRHILNH